MSTSPVMTQLRQLKLGGMAAALQTQQEQVGTYESLPFVERPGLLLDQENPGREQRKQDRLIRQAHFKLRACIQDIDYQHSRNIKPSKIAQLAQSDWIKRAQNLLITGPCGSGKTYIACAPGHNACLFGHSVRYYRLSRLMLELTQAKADGSYHKKLQQLAKVQLLIIDDWGMETLKPAQRNDLMEIMDDRHGSASTLVISLPPAVLGMKPLVITPWRTRFSTASCTMHNAHRVLLKGESMRKILSNLTQVEHLR